MKNWRILYTRYYVKYFSDMDKEKKKLLSFAEKLRRIRNAGIENYRTVNQVVETDELAPLDERIQKILGIVKHNDNNPKRMIYFVMYDITDNKIRTQISKYLIKKGCTRIQKSVFLVDTERKVYNEICETIKEVQDIYENKDSILFVPVTAEYLKAMKIIGMNIDLDIILNNKNTLFF